MNWLHVPPHAVPVQNATLFEAMRQAVSGALRHVAPPTYTVQKPPQSFEVREEQNTTVTFPPTSGVGPREPVRNVTRAGVVASQVSICDSFTRRMLSEGS